MNIVTKYATQALTVVRQIVAYLAPLEAAINVGGLDPKVRTLLATLGGGLLIVEHVLQAIQNPAKPIQHTTTTTTTYIAPVTTVQTTPVTSTTTETP